ncbi:PPE family protein [Mycolicibacter icosiumassiliensis]|uniref:PPE family protein n=1 Tax=Mycolicibacter icosiumassiliensis TaxID=1792835 RepID=UPI001AD81057|nr:PPE family protein [Mycolicibacter icosiumassiliensis]
MDFGNLPPEVNSARMYAGPGSGPLVAAAGAWDGLAGQLETASRTYARVIATLEEEGWSGWSSEAMATAVKPYVMWMTTLGSQAAEAATKARAAAVAYQHAFAATVPPKLVAANRAEFANLVDTDYLGCNTTAIAAVEAAYAEMWAQDAAAMYSYAASSSAATRLTVLTAPPQTTNPGGQSGQAAAVGQAVGSTTAGNAQASVSQLISAVPHALQTLATGGSASSVSAAVPSAPGAFSSLLSTMSGINTFSGPVSLAAGLSRTWSSAGSFGYAAKRDYETQIAAKEPKPEPQAPLAPLAPPSEGNVPAARPSGIGAPAMASLGGAGLVGRLSVPNGWAPAVPAAPVSNEPVETTLGGAPAAEASPPVLSGAPTAGIGGAAGAASRATVSSVLRVGPRRFKMPRPSFGG